MNEIVIKTVDEENWRDVAGLSVNDSQKEWVAEPAYYLCLCHYGQLWSPLAVYRGETVVGFVMWAVDPEDRSCWLGGILVDKGSQGQGIGREAVTKAMALLAEEQGVKEFALSYAPGNPARHLYRNLGFSETGEREDDEIVARKNL